MVHAPKPEAHAWTLSRRSYGMRKDYCGAAARKGSGMEKEQRKTISEIFSQAGEPAFRELESRMIRRCVREIAAGEASVVALGGGALVTEGNWELVERNGITLWLDCPLERI